jgi:hypothetical protein
MRPSLVVISPGKGFPTKAKKEPKYEFREILALSEAETNLVASAIDQITLFDKSKDIARIVVLSFEKLMSTYEDSFNSSDEIGFSSFRELFLVLSADLLNLSNSIYTFVQHQKGHFKRLYGKDSAEIRSINNAIEDMEPYHSFMLAIRHHFVHSEIGLDGSRTADPNGVIFNPTIQISKLRKTGDRRSDFEKRLSVLEDEIEIFPFIADWRQHFDDLIETVYDQRAKVANSSALLLLQTCKGHVVEQGEHLALVQLVEPATQKGIINITYRVIDLATCKDIASACGSIVDEY